MLVGRIIKLAFVVLLAIGLSSGFGVSDIQSFAGTSQATLSAAPDSGDCIACKDCAKPCVASITCGAACVSFSLVSASQIAVLLVNLEPRFQARLAAFLR